MFARRHATNDCGTSVTATGTAETGELRYHPFGATRYTSGSTPTSRRFTGQREEGALGLYFYGARWYDPALGRFVQPDTIVPQPGEAADWDRFAYVRNNPLKYTDPTGHQAVCGSNQFCLAAFFMANAAPGYFDHDGLNADWNFYRHHVWYGEQRPTDFAIWGDDPNFPEIDRAYIYDSDYLDDIASRPAYASVTTQFTAKLRADNVVSPNETFRAVRAFTLKDAAYAGRYNAVEWTLGSAEYLSTIDHIDYFNQTVIIRTHVENYSGWESATREPGAFIPYFGTAVLPNRGGRPTEGPLISEGRASKLGMWANHGMTVGQTWGPILETISFPFGGPH